MAAKSTEPTQTSGRGAASLLFGPAIGTLNRLSYAGKFVLIGVILLAPFLFVTYLQYDATTHDIDFNQAESDGVVYIMPAKDLLHQLMRRRVLTVAAAAGVSGYKEQIAAVNAEIEATLPKIDAVDATYGEALRTSKRWQEIRQSWATLAASEAGSATDVDRAHDEVIAKVKTLILEDAGNYSNLILDPDLDSYWLMDPFLARLPNLADFASQMATRALRPVREDNSSADRQLAIAGLYSSTLTALGDNINIAFKTAYRETKNPLYGQSPTLEVNLRPVADKMQAEVTTLTDHIKLAYLAGSAPAAPAPPREERGGRGRNPPTEAPTPAPAVSGTRENGRQAVEAAVQTLHAIFATYEKVGPELKWLCDRRVTKYQASRSVGLYSSVGAAALLVYLFIGFFLSVRRSIGSIDTATRRMIAGTTDRFALDTRDELGKVADSFNDINTALVEARNLRQRVEQENQELQTNIVDLLRVVSDAAEGKLQVRATVSVGALGAVADAFNQMMESFQKLIGEINTQLGRTQNAVGEINASSQKMAAGATQQAQELVDTTRLVERINSELQRVSVNANAAADATRRTEESAAEGATSVQEVMRGMASLRANVQNGAKKIKALGDRSMEITSIVNTIQRISEQTNMLALNAAIEAARAGEHGHGFTVVADEVRKLAERTAGATQEIEALIKAIQAETNESVAAIEQQTAVVEQESQVVASAGGALTRIQQVSTQSAGLVADISAVTKSQVESADKMAKAVAQVSQIAQSTQSGALGTAQLTKELAVLSEQLARSVSRFKVS